MNRPTLFRTARVTAPNLTSRRPLRRSFSVVLLALALGFFGLLPLASAVTPAPDGGYPNQNTAEGDNALLKLTTGADNTAIGFSRSLAKVIAIFHVILPYDTDEMVVR